MQPFWTEKNMESVSEDLKRTQILSGVTNIFIIDLFQSFRQNATILDREEYGIRFRRPEKNSNIIRCH